MGAPDAVRRLRGRESPQEHSRRSSNDLFFDAVSKVREDILLVHQCSVDNSSPQASAEWQTPPRPRSISIGPDAADMTRQTRTQFSYESSPYSFPETTYHMSPSSPTYEYHYASQPNLGATRNSAGQDHWAYGAPLAPNVEYRLPPSPRTGGSTQHTALPPSPRRPMCNAPRAKHGQDDAERSGYPGYPPSSTRLHLPRGPSFELSPIDGRNSNSSHMISEKNQLNTEAIELGKDMRTTVMIKNIPNKMSDQDLMSFIAKVSPRRIDFLYLRMDFQNGTSPLRILPCTKLMRSVGCNVGYAFVNFIAVGDLLHFAKTQLGVKWLVDIGSYRCSRRS